MTSMAQTSITKKIEFDAGHRLPFHDSKCRHLHGHHYVLEVTFSGEVLQVDGNAKSGMIIDFFDIKKIMYDYIGEPWDHSFIVYEKDEVVRELLSKIPNHKTVVLDVVPTAENLAAKAYQILAPRFVEKYGETIKITNVRLFESSKSWVDFTP